MKLFGSSGIRRLYSRELLELAFKVGMAVGVECRTVVVAMDTRTTGSVMKHAACAGLLAAGVHCLDYGMMPTPALAFAAREADAGIMITASHNPPEYNGLKLFNPDGTSFAGGQQKRLEAAVDALPKIAEWQDAGNMVTLEGVLERYSDYLSALLPRLDGLRVVVDAGGGATSLATPGLLEKLGCEVIRLYCTPTGFFPRPSEPAEQNLGELKKTVVEAEANLGIAHDGDGDRMVVIDENGRYVSGDRLLCLLAKQDDIKEIVTTVDATMALNETGKTVRRTPVGDTYVADELKKGGDFGGETSGCWMFPNVSLCPDGIYAAAFVASLVVEKPLSEQLASIPSYPLLRGSSPGVIENLSAVEAGLAHLHPEQIDRTDGLKMIFNDGWLLVRPSGTEPVIRLSAEARTEKRVQALYNEILEAVQTAATAGRQRV